MLLKFSFNLDLDGVFTWITAPQIILTLLFLILRLWFHKRRVSIPLIFCCFINAATACLCFQPEVGFYGIGVMNAAVGLMALGVVVKDWGRR